MFQNYLTHDLKSHGPPRSTLEPYIAVHVFAIWYRKLKCWWNYGYKGFAQNGWNLFDVAMITLYTMTFNLLGVLGV